MAREIPLTHGYVALVDDADYERVARRTWHAHPARDRVYAVHTLSPEEGWKYIRLHTFLMEPPPGCTVAFADGNPLNCTRANLVVRSRAHVDSLRGARRGVQANNKSGYKGVSWDRRTERWRAETSVGGKTVQIGRFDTPEEAARAYNEAALRLHGAGAYQNVIDGDGGE